MKGTLRQTWHRALPALAALGVLAAPTSADTTTTVVTEANVGVDWTTWVGDHRIHYWSSLLPDRVTKATYRSATLDKWWSQAAVDLQSAPRSAAERAEVALSKLGRYCRRRS